MSGLDVAEVAAAQRAAVGVLTVMRDGRPLPWAACLDDARQLPMLVNVLATRLLAALESEPVEAGEYLREWGAEAAQWAASVRTPAVPVGPGSGTRAQARLVPRDTREAGRAWQVFLEMVAARRAGVDDDGAELLGGLDAGAVLWVAVAAVASLLGTVDERHVQTLMSRWGVSAAQMAEGVRGDG